MILPRMYRVKQQSRAEPVADIEGAVSEALGKARFWSGLGPGARIGITAGSRGVAGIAAILRAAARQTREHGAEPFIIPAMGSHGCGTTTGQIEVLRGLGVTESTVGCPIRQSSQAVEVGRLPDGTPLYQNPLTRDCDGVILVNRVKPHTSFRGIVESGLLKMLVVGLGNPAGANVFHRLAPQALGAKLLEMGRALLDITPVRYGLAVLETAEGCVADVDGIEPEHIEEKEAELLVKARKLMPSIPFCGIHLLIVEEMGKCFSGTGMDTNVIGRLRIQGEPEPEKPGIARIVVLGLAEASHGNAHGIGLADFTTKRLVAAIDWEATYLNAITSSFIQRAFVPITLPGDRDAIDAAIRSLGGVSPGRIRAVWIKNTLHIDEIIVSEALKEEACANPDLTMDGAGFFPDFAGGRLAGGWD